MTSDLVDFSTKRTRTNVGGVMNSEEFGFIARNSLIKQSLADICIELGNSMVANPSFDFENFSEKTVAKKIVGLATEILNEVTLWGEENLPKDQENWEEN